MPGASSGLASAWEKARYSRLNSMDIQFCRYHFSLTPIPGSANSGNLMGVMWLM